MIDLPDISAKRAALAPDRVAMEEVGTGRVLTYADLDRRAVQAASLMADRKIGPGDRVAILCRNRTAFFELLFACGKLGAILVPLNWRMPPAELDQLLTDCTPKLLFYGAEDEAVVGRIMYPPPTIALDGDYEGLVEKARPRSFRTLWPASDIWYLLYTSGTTGRPKGVIHNYGMVLANYVNIGSAIDLGSQDTTLNFLPLFHTAGINLHTLPTLMAGGRVLVMTGFNADLLVGQFEQRRIDTFFAVPTIFQELLDHPRFAAAPLGHVRHWGCGGAPLPDALAERYRELGLRVCNGMGMTETGPTAFLTAPADAWDHIGSVGKPQLLCSARIVDSEGKDVADEMVGELLFAGPGISPGYWRNEEATKAAFTPDGWLRSGDLARRDAQGFYYVTGRQKEMFISGGENVYPAEVENVLCSHPAVAEAAIVARPDPKWGEAGRAFLVLREGAAAPTDELMHEFCRGRLAPYKIPRSFEYVADFPRTAAGKIQKHLLD
ncbi:MAG: long-chain fatty acid--CoA ligase [Sphingosinicella sp.]|nr:long-chain fatty acid--CoA ligase [Sphingosinicella sp.]